MIPPEFAPHRTETQRVGDDIVTAVRNLRHDWPHMIQPGETQAPGAPSRHGTNQGERVEGAPEHDVDQSYDRAPNRKGASDSDTSRITKTLSLRREVQDALNGWSRIVIEERGSQPTRRCDHGKPLVTLRWPWVGPTLTRCPAKLPWFLDDEGKTFRGVHRIDGADVPGMCEFVQRHAEWLGEHEAGKDCRDELKEFAQRAHLIVSPPRRETMSIGRCPLEAPGEQDVLEVCGGDVRARTGDEHLLDGKAWATCNQCGEVSPAEWWAERMFIDGESSPLVTIGELVAVIAYRLRVVVTHEQVRQWKHRGKIESAGSDNRGRTLYRHEEVVDAIRADVRAKAAKVVG